MLHPEHPYQSPLPRSHKKLIVRPDTCDVNIPRGQLSRSRHNTVGIQ